MVHCSSSKQHFKKYRNRLTSSSMSVRFDSRDGEMSRAERCDVIGMSSVNGSFLKLNVLAEPLRGGDKRPA